MGRGVGSGAPGRLRLSRPRTVQLVFRGPSRDQRDVRVTAVRRRTRREARNRRERSDGAEGDEYFFRDAKSKSLAETGSSRVDDTSTAGAETGKPAAASKAPFVKFVCVPGLPRHKTVCEPGVPVPSELRLVTNTKSLQRLSDFCGLEQISTRSWIANVVGTAPAGLPLDPWTTHPTTVPVNQTGIFSSPANGVALSALCGRPTSAAELLPRVTTCRTTCGPC